MALFWLSERAAIEPHLPRNQPGARRVDDRRVISGILHVLKVGCRWCDCPTDYGPSKTVYNRFNRWSPPGLLAHAARRLGGCRRGDEEHRHRQHLRQGAAGRVRCKRGRSAQAIGRSRGGWTTKVHALTDVIGRPYALMLTAGNVQRREGRTRAPQTGWAHALPTGRQDSDQLRRSLRDAGAVPVIPGRRSRKRAICYDKERLSRPSPHRERLLPPQGLPPRANFLSGVALATAIAFWL
jgi:transposase